MNLRIGNYEVDTKKISPMMRQYCTIKENHMDAIVMFRLGDFYEMFFGDAEKASKILGLTLTGRDCGLEERAPMCGVPYHAVDGYIRRLVECGQKVAVCEQVTEPTSTKELAEREVTRVVTAGTITDSDMLDDSVNNYICSIYYDKAKKVCSVASADVSTGEAYVRTFCGEYMSGDVISELLRRDPAEIVFTNSFFSLKEVADFVKNKMDCPVSNRDTLYFTPDFSRKTLFEIFHTDDLKKLGLSEDGTDCRAVCGLFDYITDNHRACASRFTSIQIISESAYVGVDSSAQRNLELVETIRTKEKKGSLLWVLDHTKTSMGRRMLRNWIEQPLRSVEEINERLDAVERLTENSVVMGDIRSILENVYDIGRLITKVVYNRANPHDLKTISITARQIPELKSELEKLGGDGLLKKCSDGLGELSELYDYIDSALCDEPPIAVKNGGVIREGFNKELDDVRHIMNHGEELIQEIEQRERERTGIKNLKTGYNRVFGYFLEVTRSYYDMIPPEWTRKQTLANSERFITSELKDAENQILNAKERAIELETEIFKKIVEYVSSMMEVIEKTAFSISVIDILCSFADTAIKNRYTKPVMCMDGTLEIKDGRHPVVELMLQDGLFVPNDTVMNNDTDRMLIITGPNMAGKSTYMRQIALIVLMAHIGSFVPSSYAKISVVDRIFTRIGASDDLSAGDSTFMVEMREVADILENATPESLVILDEVGRGTSTYDGMSIARAVAEYICCNINLGCKTLFATHYHELTELENEIDGIKNYSVEVEKTEDGIRFMRRIVRGGADESYGIEVAKLAGLPDTVIDRARYLLSEIEKNSGDDV